MPQGLARTVVPAAPASWIAALARFGTMRFADVAHYAARYAREGFPAYPVFADFIATNEAAYRRTHLKRFFFPEAVRRKWVSFSCKVIWRQRSST